MSKAIIRLFVCQKLFKGAVVCLNQGQKNYCCNVMRLKLNNKIKVFNEECGQWLAKIFLINKKELKIEILLQENNYISSFNVWLCIAMVKGDAMKSVIRQSTELGVSKIMIFNAHHSVVHKINLEKLNSIAIEAAEQCERNTIPKIIIYDSLKKLLNSWQPEKTMFFANERVSCGSRTIKFDSLGDISDGVGLIIGPEGGFSTEEINLLRQSYVVVVSMGRLILKVDTAVVSMLSMIKILLNEFFFVKK